LFQEVEEPVLRLADALPQALAAWDASACARRDATADVNLAPQRQKVDGVEK
jgi:hypothetical protein